MRAALALFLLTSPVLAADLLVAPGGDIQAVIDVAASGDRVLVPAGTYLQTIDFKGKAIAVIGVDGATATVLDAMGAGSVVYFGSGEHQTSRLSGFTVTGGNNVTGGAGIRCVFGSTPWITDCVIRSNFGKLGAGVAGSPVMERCLITGNVSSLNHGGGLFGAPTLRNCVIAANTVTSADGGGLYVNGGHAIVEDCVFVDNKAVFADSHGGGIYVNSPATLEIRRSLIVGNSATGGVFAGYGGGMRVEAVGSTMDRCTVTANVVTGSSTLGAGVYGPLAISNSIIRDNVGGQVDLATIQYSSVTGGAPGIGNVDLDPSFVESAMRDFHLDHGSALIDLGDPASVDPDGTRADMGAFPFATLYARVNADPFSWDAPAWAEVSAELGGLTRMRLLAGNRHAGELYWILGSVSGQTPGVDLLGAHLPLNFDSYMLLTLTMPTMPALSGFLGTLDASGRGDATLTVPGMSGGPLAGVTASHAALAGLPGVTTTPFVSSVLDVTFE